jgi:hypothetical protein
LLKADLSLDFAAFDSSISRLQFLFDSNNRERERYEKDKQQILVECQSVRDTNSQLRDQLEEARATLAQRKKFDELAEKITANRLLRPREDQIASLAKLEEECRDLEKESETYSETWRERKDQFNRIMEEGMLLRRQIRDEKEEVDRREGMNEDGEEDGEVSRDGQTPGNTQSGNATPHVDSGTISRGEGDANTPMASAQNGGRTPGRESPGADGLRPKLDGLRTSSRSGSRAGSREVSPAPKPWREDADEGADVQMDDAGRPDAGGYAAATPTITVEEPQPSDDKMEVDAD